MTRELEIAVASCAYGSKGSSFDFEAGARWADIHPKSPWISVEDDLPCNHEELKTVDSKGRPETKRVIVRYTEETFSGNEQVRHVCCKMSQWDGTGKYRWHISEGRITHWMPIPELPKE